MSDRDLLTEIVANLLDNAIRHTPSGTRIEVTLARRDTKIIAGVADNGPGVPMEDRDRVFRRFYRPKHSVSIPGTGLGLALVAAVAELYEVDLTAEDDGPCLRV